MSIAAQCTPGKLVCTVTHLKSTFQGWDIPSLHYRWRQPTPDYLFFSEFLEEFGFIHTSVLSLPETQRKTHTTFMSIFTGNQFLKTSL